MCDCRGEKLLKEMLDFRHRSPQPVGSLIVCQCGLRFVPLSIIVFIHVQYVQTIWSLFMLWYCIEGFICHSENVSISVRR